MPGFVNRRLTIRRYLMPAVLTFGLTVFMSAVFVYAQRHSPVLQNPTSGDPVPRILLLQIVRAEDERRWDKDLRDLFQARNANVRTRAALAAGRIGDEAAVPDLVNLLEHDDETMVRAIAAFALGETESPLAADALTRALADKQDAPVRARAVEALGKIAAALPETDTRRASISKAVLDALSFEARRRSRPDPQTILLGLTAVLRAKPTNAGSTVAEFLHYGNGRIREDAANTLARLKLKDGNEALRKLLVSDPDPIVRANAARVLGATEDKRSFDPLLDRATKDADARVRVSAVRALGQLKDTRASKPLLRRYPLNNGLANLNVAELLNLATALGQINAGTADEEVWAWLSDLRKLVAPALEVEAALARVSPKNYLIDLSRNESAKRAAQRLMLTDWRAAAALANAQSLIQSAAVGKAEKEQAVEILRAMLDYRNSGLNINTFVAVHSENAIPSVLNAYAEFKPDDLEDVLRKHLLDPDVIVRATAAELLGNLPSADANTRALATALGVALRDKDLNDAALAIIDSLGKQKKKAANEAIESALDSSDYLVRRRAVQVLKANGAGDFSSRIGIVQTRNTPADYARAVDRIGKKTYATVKTNKGSFTIEFLPEDAPLNVDNFIQLAKRKFFNGIVVHRVVPNFVIQDGDPRGDGNGGPGFQIRCEINMAPYERGAVGMALSGKDTGGSQWFITHSPQPHLDGGYTVFGNVISGMNVVDNIVVGDLIQSVSVSEPRRTLRP
jgi:cyclophilin family peptidyl-prolyl cis-trans isomerase/HEAT repeat protein